MPSVLTEASTIKCVHQGTVQVTATQTQLVVDGKAVLLQGDILAATISNCQLPLTGNNKQCTKVVSMLVGSATQLGVGAQKVVLETANGVTDSVPPGTWSVITAGQTKLQSE